MYHDCLWREKCKSTSPNALQVKNRRKTAGVEVKLGERIFYIFQNVRRALVRITESSKPGTKVFWYLPQTYQNQRYQKLWMSLTFLLNWKEMYCIEMCVCVYTHTHSRYILYSFVCPLVV